MQSRNNSATIRCCNKLVVLLFVRTPTKIPRMGVEKGLDCTNAYRLLIAGTEAWTSQAEVELAESEPAAALELCAVQELALVRALPRQRLLPLAPLLLLLVIPSIARCRLVGLDLSTQNCFSGNLSVYSSPRSLACATAQS